MRANIPTSLIDIPGGFIRPLHESDVTDDYVCGLNDTEVNRYLEVRHITQTYTTVTNFVRLNRRAKDMVLWGIWLERESQARLVGTLRLHGVDFKKNLGYLGICLFDKSTWGKGLGVLAITKVTACIFETTQLETIQVSVDSQNTASQKAFLKAGYRFDGAQIRKPSCNSELTLCRIYTADRMQFQISP